MAPGETFTEGRSLVEMYDFPDLGKQIITLRQDISNLQRQIDVQTHSKDNKDLDASKRADMEKDIQSAAPSLKARRNRWRPC